MKLILSLILAMAVALIGLLVFLLFRASGGRRRATLSILVASPLVFVGSVCLVLTLPGLFDRWGGPPAAVEEIRQPPEPAPQEESPAAAPLAPRALAIGGRILDRDLKPLSGVEVALGEETAASGPEGVFSFPSAVRAGRRTLVLRRDGAEAHRWEGIITGAIAPGDGDPSESGVDPETIRWTIVLWGSGAERPIAEARAVLMEEWGPTGEARIDGVSALPDGAHLDVALYFNEKRMLSSADRAEVRDGRFSSRCRFPDDFRIHSSRYDLRILFSVGQEDPADVEGWKASRPDLDWSATATQTTVQRIFAGDPVEEAQEDRKIESHYKALLDSIDRIRKLLIARSRRARELARGWDPEALRSLHSLEKDSPAGPILDAEGRLDQAAWRKLMDEGVRPEIQRLLERHLRERTGKYRDADFLMESVLKRLHVFSKVESLLAWSAWGIDPHPNDFYMDEERPEGDEGILNQIIEKDLALLRRYATLTQPDPATGKEGEAGAGKGEAAQGE